MKTYYKPSETKREYLKTDLSMYENLVLLRWYFKSVGKELNLFLNGIGLIDDSVRKNKVSPYFILYTKINPNKSNINI